ncbi:SRPBCC family protein [Mycolicibacterium sp. BiH015]|uniref:SRPBCC family protein n=1 Tax=Mycolicibacterium sp. BiH015 TaxID=3018808 RepID=UPI003FA545D9
MPATPDVVFDEWLDPEALADWMCPRPSRCVAITIEAHVGGRVRFDVDTGVGGDDRPLVLITGQFLDIDRPHRLRFSWSHSRWSDPTAQSIVDVVFEPHGDDATLMSIEHSLLPQEGFDDHDRGWSVTADQLRHRLTVSK